VILPLEHGLIESHGTNMRYSPFEICLIIFVVHLLENMDNSSAQPEKPSTSTQVQKPTSQNEAGVWLNLYNNTKTNIFELVY
jgi:hypothetical protein